MNYALIKDGIVVNRIWLSASNAQDFPGAVQTGGLHVRVGDTYADGCFYRDGEKLFSPENMIHELMGGVEDVRYE